MKFQSAFAFLAITSATQGISRSGPEYEFPGWDVIGSTGETHTFEFKGSDLSVSWSDFFNERH